MDLPVTIRIQGDKYQGRITSIANQHQPQSWISGEIREYAVIVLIEKLVSEGNLAEFSLTDKNGKSVDARQFDKDNDRVIKREELPDEDEALGESFEQVDVNRDGQLDPRDQLKPGMTADATITVETLTDVLKVPVTAVVSKGSTHYCWVVKGDKPERRAVKLGRTDDSHYQVLDGVGADDEVIMNPRTSIDEARKLEQEARTEEAVQRTNGTANGVPVTPEKPGALPPGAKAPPGAPGAAGPGPGGAKGPPRKRPDLKSADKDGDGKISREEAPEWMQTFFDRLDANSDGFIDAQEQAEMRKRASGGGRGGPGGPGQGPP
jgi:hypothetical protein